MDKRLFRFYYLAWHVLSMTEKVDDSFSEINPVLRPAALLGSNLLQAYSFCTSLGWPFTTLLNCRSLHKLPVITSAIQVCWDRRTLLRRRFAMLLCLELLLWFFSGLLLYLNIWLMLGKEKHRAHQSQTKNWNLSHRAHQVIWPKITWY